MSSVKLKNVSGEVLYVGRPDGKRVDVGEVIEVDGAVAKDGPEDAFLIGEGDDARLWPKAHWDVPATSSKKGGDS